VLYRNVMFVGIEPFAGHDRRGCVRKEKPRRWMRGREFTKTRQSLKARGLLTALQAARQ
jgi:hypothetical protein